MCYPVLFVDNCGLLWIIDCHGPSWMIVDSFGLSLITMDYGLWWIIMNYYGLWTIMVSVAAKGLSRTMDYHGFLNMHHHGIARITRYAPQTSDDT
jgi:hypothetical protein